MSPLHLETAPTAGFDRTPAFEHCAGTAKVRRKRKFQRVHRVAFHDLGKPAIARSKISRRSSVCFSSVFWMKTLRPGPSFAGSSSVTRRAMMPAFSSTRTGARQGDRQRPTRSAIARLGQARVLLNLGQDANVHRVERTLSADYAESLPYGGILRRSVGITAPIRRHLR